MRTEFLCTFVLKVASRPKVKLATCGCKSALNPSVVYSTDRSKAVVPVLVLLFVALWFILRGDLFYVLPCVILCFSVLFSIAIASLGEERAYLNAVRTFVRFVLAWFCLFSLPLGVWEELQLVIVALPGLFSYLFFPSCSFFFRWSLLFWNRSVPLTYLCRMDSSAFTLGLELPPILALLGASTVFVLVHFQ